MAIIQPIRAIVSDLDGTLYPINELHQPTIPLPPGFHRNLETFSDLIDHGNDEETSFPSIAFCTGREINYVIGATRMLKTPRSSSIIENGLYLYNLFTGERIYHPAVTKEIVEVFRVIRSRIPKIELEEPLVRAYLHKEVNISFERRSSHVDLTACMSTVHEVLSDLMPYIDIAHSGFALDLMPKGVNKGSGLVELSKQTDIPLAEILVIGDSPNDFPAMEVVGYAGCPGNATPACKDFVRQKGGIVSDYDYVIGVVDIIERCLSATN